MGLDLNKAFKTSIFRHATVTKNAGKRIAGKKVARPKWHFIDGKDKVVGRLASDISRVLMGKHKPTYLPNIDSGDYVVVTNARHVALTGKKMIVFWAPGTLSVRSFLIGEVYMLSHE